MATTEQTKKRQRSQVTAATGKHEQNGKASGKEVEKAARAPTSTAEEDFPRGGADALTALERRELTEAARRDVEQELAEGKAPKTKKPRSSKQTEDGADDSLLGGKDGLMLEGRVAKHVDLLRAKNLSPGTRLWGMVLEVTPRGLVVSLPHGLRGYVAPNQASDVLALLLKAQSGSSDKKVAALLEAAGGAVPPLTDLFAVGQFVRCVVVEAPQKEPPPAGAASEGAGSGGRSNKHVSLSLLLRKVQGGLGPEALVEGLALGACVRSVEDHGYTLSFGISGASGFLRKKDHEAQFGEGVALQVGGLLDVVIRNADDKRHVTVSCAPGEVAAAVTREEAPAAATVTLDSLLPGTLLNVKVRKVLSNGLIVSFLTFFHGTIDTLHLPPANPTAAGSAAAASADWRKAYTEGAKLRARLLYVDPASKRAGLSLLPHLLSLSLPSPVPMLGSVFPEATVARLDNGGPGLMLTLPGLAEGSLAGYCHVSNALEEKVEREAAVAELGKRFKPGTQLPARVIGYRLMDGIAAVTVRPSQVNAAVLSYADLAPGMLVPATVVSVPDRDGDGPLLLSVAEGVRGLVPPMHAAELTGSVGGTQNGTGARKMGRVKVKVGERVEARVLEVDPVGRRLTLTLRKTLLAGKAAPLVNAAQARPGARFQGLVTGFNDRVGGVYVSFFGGLSGLASSTELGLEAGQSAKDLFAVGQVVKATILSVDPKGRLSLSLAPKSDAAAAAAATSAAAGAAPKPPTVAPNGEAVDALGGLQPGDFAEAVVLSVHEAPAGEAAAAGGVGHTSGTYYLCRLELPRGAGGVAVKGRLEVAHLSDHPSAVEAFKEVVRPGCKLGRVLVLERLEAQRCVRLSRKPCLLAAAAAGTLPRSFSEVTEGALVPGFVASVTPDAVYVRFLSGLTGRAGLPQLSDVFVSNPRQLFSEGQSVRAQVATTDPARQRFTLLLRPSVTASTDGAYLLHYFRELEALQALRTEGEEGPAADSDPARLFPLGSLAGARVHDVKEYGILCDMDGHPDLVGLVPSSHTGSSRPAPAVGSQLKGRVMDVVAAEGLVELSLQPQLVVAAKDTAATKAAAKKLKSGTSVEAVVEGIRPGEYLILSLPQHGSMLAYAPVSDYNLARPETVPRTFTVGQRLEATVAVMPPDAPPGRILCHVPLTRVATEGMKGRAASANGGAANGAAAAAEGASGHGKLKLEPGAIVKAVVTGIQPYQLDVSIGGGRATGRIHLTEVLDIDVAALQAASKSAAPGSADAGAATVGPAKKKARKGESAAAVPAAAAAVSCNPLDQFRMEQVVEAVVLGRLQGTEGHVRGVMDLSLRPSRLALASKAESQPAPVTLSNLVPGQQLSCFVLEADNGALWLSAGPAVRGRCAVLDASTDPNTLANLFTAFPPGTPVLARVLSVAPKRHTLDLSLIDPCSGSTHGSVGAAPGQLPPEGSLVMGRIVAVSGAGLRVALGHKRSGSVALTDIHDEWAADALAGLNEGQYARLRVVGSQGDFAVLSLRPSRGGAIAGVGAGKVAGAGGEAATELVDGTTLATGKMVRGYVKRCDAKGLFLALDRHRDGRIKLGNLSDGFIEDPPAAFPAGMRLEARVLRVQEDGKVELTLRTSSRQPSTSAIQSLSDLHVGQLVTGRVRRVEKFGVFVEVEGNPAVVGLAHITELAEAPVKDINTAFKAKQTVRVVVTKIDLEAKRLSLSLKPWALKAAEEAEGVRGGKRRRGADIDEEMVEAAEAQEDSEEGQGDGDSDSGDDGSASGSEGEDDSDDDGEKDEQSSDDDDDKAAGSDVDVDDVDVSEEDDDDDEEMAAAGAADSGSSSEGEEGEEEGGSAFARSRPGGTSTGDLDLTAPWGELLLADDPRARGGSGRDAGEGAGAGDSDGKKLSKAQKKRLKEQHEQDIRAAELARLSGSSAPTTPADFERLVLASPSSSFVWIKYMALHISLGDVDAARKVAQRALDMINYREEGEKFNVWVAWLNLENAYGTSPTPEEAAMGLLRKALQYTEPKKMYLAALGIFERSGRDELAEQVVRTMTKKFGGSAKVWARAIERALQRNDGESARQLLERSLQSLPARKHIKALVRTALAEFRLGSAERGRGILEGVLRNHPRRLDLWNVYIDQELKTGEQARIRALFERATHLPLPPKKMKFLFRRYLEYEKAEGAAAAVEHVKRRAMEFVESSLKA